MPAEVWKDSDEAGAFLAGGSFSLLDRPRQLEVLLRVVRSFCGRVLRVADLGAGDGILLEALLDAFPDAAGVAAEFSPPMIEQAKRRLDRFGQRAAVVERDFQTPDWQRLLDGPFDVVVSGFAIHHLTDERKRSLYREIHGLLSDGGVFVNCEHVASATPRIASMFDDARIEHLYQQRHGRGESVTLEEVRREFLARPDRAANVLAMAEDQCRWLREIGYRDVGCFWKYFGWAVFGGSK